jgi:hypothetical protein
MVHVVNIGFKIILRIGDDALSFSAILYSTETLGADCAPIVRNNGKI